MDAEQIHGVIYGLTFMHGLEKGSRKRIATAFEDVSFPEMFPEDTEMFTEGDSFSNEGYILLVGEVRVQKTSSPEIYVDSPQILGEIKQFNSAQTRSATVTSVSDLDVLKFDWGKFDELLIDRLNDDEIEAFKAALEEFAWGRMYE